MLQLSQIQQPTTIPQTTTPNPEDRPAADNISDAQATAATSAVPEQSEAIPSGGTKTLINVGMMLS